MGIKRFNLNYSNVLDLINRKDFQTNFGEIYALYKNKKESRKNGKKGCCNGGDSFNMFGNFSDGQQRLTKILETIANLDVSRQIKLKKILGVDEIEIVYFDVYNQRQRKIF